MSSIESTKTGDWSQSHSTFSGALRSFTVFALIPNGMLLWDSWTEGSLNKDHTDESMCKTLRDTAPWKKMRQLKSSKGAMLDMGVIPTGLTKNLVPNKFAQGANLESYAFFIKKEPNRRKWDFRVKAQEYNKTGQNYLAQFTGCYPALLSWSWAAQRIEGWESVICCLGFNHRAVPQVTGQEENINPQQGRNKCVLMNGTWEVRSLGHIPWTPTKATDCRHIYTHTEMMSYICIGAPIPSQTCFYTNNI